MACSVSVGTKNSTPFVVLGIDREGPDHEGPDRDKRDNRHDRVAHDGMDDPAEWAATIAGGDPGPTPLDPAAVSVIEAAIAPRINRMMPGSEDISPSVWTA